MFRIVSIAAALVASTMVLGATASHAQGAYYTATPVAQPAKTSYLVRETVWTWNNGALVARKGSDRDLIACSAIAGRAGKLSAFTVGGTALDAATLDKCNAKAK